MSDKQTGRVQGRKGAEQEGCRQQEGCRARRVQSRKGEGSSALRGCTPGSRCGDVKRPRVGGCSPKVSAWEMLIGQPKTAQCPGFGVIRSAWCWAGLWAQPSSCSQGHSSTALTQGSLKTQCQGAATPLTPLASLQKALPGGFGSAWSRGGAEGGRGQATEATHRSRAGTHRRHRAYAPFTDSLSRTRKEPSRPALASSSSATTWLMSRWYHPAVAILSRRVPVPAPHPAQQGLLAVTGAAGVGEGGGGLGTPGPRCPSVVLAAGPGG